MSLADFIFWPGGVGVPEHEQHLGFRFVESSERVSLLAGPTALVGTEPFDDFLTALALGEDRLMSSWRVGRYPREDEPERLFLLVCRGDLPTFWCEPRGGS